MKREIASIAKITPPKVERIFPRKRLFDLLDSSIPYPVIWISGPAGCGKTSLVASYLIKKNISYIWYQVDERDEDLASFFYYIGYAAKRACPHRHKSLPLLTFEYLSGIPTFTQRYFDNLYSWLLPPFFLVFDDYHRVTFDSPFHEVIFNGISNAPKGVRVILISRREPPTVYSRLRAHDQMKLIGWDELRFTLEESRNIIASRIPKLRSKEKIEHLHKIADGWVAGLILISDAVRRGINPQSLEKSSPEEIMDYFGNELFNKTKEELKIFLMKTAFLPSMTTKMAHALTGFPDSGNFLETLTKDNYFIVKHYHTEPIYQYHPLFRNFLIVRAKDSFSRKILTDLYHRAAMLLEEFGQSEEAAQIYIDLKNWEGLTQLVMKHVPFLMDRGRYQTLEKWLTSFPESLIEHSPWLLYWLGICRFPLDLSLSQSHLKKAYEKFRKEEDIVGRLLSWSGIDAIHYQVLGFHEKCIEAVSEGLELSRTNGIHIVDQPFLVHVVMSGINVNDLETAREFLDRLSSSFCPTPSSNDILDIRNRYIYHFSSARYALVSGNPTQFNHHMALAFRYGDEIGSPIFKGGDYLMNAIAMHRFGNKKEAIEHLEKGSIIAQETQSKMLLFNSLLSRAYFNFEKGDEASGLKSLKMALNIGKDQKLLNTHFDDPKVTANLCARALEAGIEVDYVREIIQRRRLIPDKDPFQIENWPWPLKIYTLGRFGILKNGKAIQFSRKIQEKPLSMLKVLISLGGRGVREEDLSDILWPEADGDAAHHSFEITLHRLRMLIDYPKAFQLHEGRLTLDSRYCWVDAWAFERLLKEVDTEGWRDESIPIAQKAIGMYRGAFLAKEIDHSWLISMRERLRSKFLRSVNRLGDHWCQSKKWVEALECYQKGMEIDDLAEEFCRGAMICYQNLGLESNALSLYNRFEKRVKAVLGIEPSPKTKTLRDEIIKSRIEQ